MADDPAGKSEVLGAPIRFLSVGKWERRKGFDILLRCFQEVFGDSNRAELVLHCFSGPIDEAAIRQEAGALLRHGQSPNIK